MKREEVSKNINKFYLFGFFREWVFWIPIIVLFWQANGLSLTQIMFLQSLFAISVVLLEVPTGVVADKIGRKISLSAGAFLLIIGFSYYAIGHSFWQFFGAEFILALGISFISGADSALIYDSLKQLKKESLFKKVRGNAESAGFLAAALSSILGGFIAIYSLRLTFWFSVIGMVLCFFVALNFVEPKLHKKIIKEKSYLKHTLECFKESFTNKNLLFLLLFFSILTLFFRVSLWFYQPYMKLSGWDIVYFGIIWASFNFLAIGGSKLSDKLETKLGEQGSLWFMVLTMTFSLIFMSYWFVLFGVVFIFLQQFVRGFSKPVLEGYSHSHLTSEKRATLMSIQNMAGNLIFAIFGPVYGYIADKFSLSTSLFVSGISCFILFAILLFWKKKNQR